MGGGAMARGARGRALAAAVAVGVCLAARGVRAEVAAAEPADLGAGVEPEPARMEYELSEDGAVMLQMDSLLKGTAEEFPSAAQCYDLWLEGNLDQCVTALQNAGAELPENFTAEVEARWMNTPPGRALGRAAYWGSGFGWWVRLFRPPPCQWAWFFWGVFC